MSDNISYNAVRAYQIRALPDTTTHHVEQLMTKLIELGNDCIELSLPATYTMIEQGIDDLRRQFDIAPSNIEQLRRKHEVTN